jgi:uncharacterized protein YjbI with pentapeptide repeats
MLAGMARARGDRPIPPRLPPALAPEHGLTLTAGDQMSGSTIEGDFSGAELEALEVEESHIVRSSFIAADLSRLSLIDVLIEGSDFSGADMEEASLTRVTFKGCRMSGARLSRTKLRDVSFSLVRLDDCNLRMSAGERVFFDCVDLKRGDFYSANPTVARFYDCDLTGADLSQAKLPGARFHGSILWDLKGGEYLRDVVIDSTQVIPLATGVFAGLNIRIEDERDAPPP